MVLSNKRLKQKLRAAKAELIAASEAENNLNSGNSDSKTAHFLRTILNPEAQKPGISKREKRRQKAKKENAEISKSGDISDDAEGQKQDGLKSDAVEVKKKKRKRDESKASENVKEKRSEHLKKKKKNPRKKKKPKKEVGNEKVKEEGVKQNESGATGEQLSAKTDESTDRKDVEISTKVYVGGIPYYSTEDDIRSYFEGCGTITSVDCMTFPDTGKFRGIAIITFKTEAAAKRALALDGSDMGGLVLKIQPFRSAKVHKSSNFSPSVLEGYNRIYVGNLSWDITENDLRKLFADCTITSIRFGEDKETGEFKGYAHVDFADNLSLNMALKLDQKIVCERPVRISCAVPKKGTVTKSQSMPEDNQVDSSKVTAGEENRVNNTDVNAVSSKIRRRTCYECGERGHVSSSCPKKQAADTKSELMPKDDQVDRGIVTAVDEKQVNSSGANAAVDENQVSSGANPVSSKIRRRTCYECGERGHLSSSCPKIQTVDTKSESMPKDNPVDSGNATAVDENQVNSTEVNALSSKIRRRTCYECGEHGHVSSSCPKKQAADSTNRGAT